MKKEINGLTEAEVKRSYNLYGDNSLQKERKKGFLRKFFENLADPIIRVLIVALVLQVIFSFGNINYYEIAGILIAILLSATVSTASEHRSENAFEKLNSNAQTEGISVLRDGHNCKINVSDLVVGDTVYLIVGNKIPADGEIIQGRITVDQSSLNGESVEVVKMAGSDYGWDLSSRHKVFRGTTITDGSAIMRVGRVGNNTYYGMMAKDVQTETRVSPLKLRLGKLASQVSRIGYVAAAFVGLTYLFNAIVVDNGFYAEKIMAFMLNPTKILTTVIGAVTLMITVVVVAAPEGLPMMITVVLSANMKRMLSDNILIKKLVGIETAGSMNILFTDKTGTITEGRPMCDRFIYVGGSCRSLSQLKRTGKIYEALVMCAQYNTDVIRVGDELTGGNATDRAIYEFFMECDTEPIQVLSKIPFSSERKYSSAKLMNGRMIVKGAAEIIMANSKYALNSKGERIRFNQDNIMADYLEATNRGERVIAVALKEGDTEDFIFVSLVSMKDKIRDGVTEAVKTVINAGIQVVMITGDGKETACAIAEECGIYSKKVGHRSVSSDEMRLMNDDDLKKILPQIRVVYRALPQDKTRLVQLSQDLDLVVGMTGDGINDAPALKLSDVGFAMGSGTEIAKSAADVVILDNSFQAISRTILYGRTIFKSIRKFITFQLTMNIAACGVALFGQFVGIDTPITIIQMLWVNIIMDTLGGLAFAGEAPLDYYMKEKPKSRNEQILSRDMLGQIGITGIYTLAICILFLTSPVIRLMYGGINPTDRFYTAFYALFIFCGLFNCFSARSSRLWILSNISKNKPFILIMMLISVIQICMIYFGGSIFRCVPLVFKELSFVVLLASTVIPFEMVRRLIYKLK